MTEDSKHLGYSKEMCELNVEYANKLIELAKKYNSPEDIGPIEKLRKESEDILQEINEDSKEEKLETIKTITKDCVNNAEIDLTTGIISGGTDKKHIYLEDLKNFGIEWLIKLRGTTSYPLGENLPFVDGSNPVSKFINTEDWLIYVLGISEKDIDNYGK